MAGDPDDSLAEATSLGAISTTATTVNDEINPDTDVDMYRFRVTANLVVDFDIDTLLNGPGGLGSYLRLFNSQGQELAFNNDALAPGEDAVGFDAYLRYTFTTSGNYYIGVSNATNTDYNATTGNGDVAGGQYATGMYTLIVQALPVDPDDTLIHATVLGSISSTPKIIDDKIAPDIDVDIYRFTVTAGEVVDFDIDTTLNGAGGLGSYLRLFNGQGQQLAFNNDAVAPGENVIGFDAYLRYTFATSGSYYIGVSNATNTQYNPSTGTGDTAGGPYSIGDYQLIVQTAPVVPVDKDDAFSEATSLGAISTTPKSTDSSITPDVDVDMYRFTVSKGQVLDFDIDTALNGSGGLGSFLRLFDAQGQQLASNDDAIAPGENEIGFDAYLRYTFATAGTYFVGVSNTNNRLYDPETGDGDRAGGPNATGDYTLVVQALPVDSDDAISEATSLGAISTTAKTVDSSIVTDIDVDMYGFRVSAGQVVDFDIDTALNGPGGLGSYIRLFNGQGQELAANNNGAAPGELVVGFDAYLRYTFPTAGTYYLGVSNATNVLYDPTTGTNDTAGGRYSIGDYQLIVQTAPTDVADTDDAISEATVLGAISTTPKTVDASITLDVDVDMYRFTVTAGQVVDFDIDTPLNGPGGLGSYLRLFNGQGQELAANNDGAAPGENDIVYDSYLRRTFAASGTFYVGISNVNNTQYDPLTGDGDTAGGLASVGSYQLIVQALPVDTDDSLIEATSLGVITTTAQIVNSAITTDIDVDVYGFTVKANQVVDFDIDTALNGPGGLGSYLRVFNAQGQQLAFNNDGAAPGESVLGFDAYLRYTFPTAGSYYIGVSNFNNVTYDPVTGNGDTAGGRDSIGSYQLIVQAVQAGSETLTVSISPASISENGGTATGTVTRSNADIGQSLVVTLGSSDTSEATVPAIATIPANQVSTTFAIQAVDDALLDGKQTATITVSAAGYVGDSADIDVTDFETVTVTINPAAISENGGTATGTVSRSNTNISASLVVTLSSSDTSEASVPSLIVIPANQASTTFTVTAVDDTLLDDTQTVTISATATGYVDTSAVIEVTDYETLAVTISPATIGENGETATGHVTRSNTNIVSALTVTLSSSDTSEAIVPAVVTIPAGKATGTFTVTAVDDALFDGTQTVTITATSTGYVGGSGTVDVTDVETLAVTISPAAISESGGTATGTVTRSNTDDGTALTVTLTSNDTSEATVPTTITVPAGQASATFIVTAVDDSLGDGTQHVVVTASAAGFPSASAELDVNDDEPGLVLSLSGDLLSEHGGTVQGTISRVALDTSQPLVVDVASSDVTEAAVPATVTIPGGQTSAVFTITGVDDAQSDGVQRATITVSAPGFLSDAKEVLVADDERPYQNPRDALDVDGDQSLSPFDALIIINILNEIGTGPAAEIMAQYQGPPVFPDTSGDNAISPLDALFVINELNAPGSRQGEGEAAAVQASRSTPVAAPLPALAVDAIHAQSTAVVWRPSQSVAAEDIRTGMERNDVASDRSRAVLASQDRARSKRLTTLDELFAELGTP